MPFRELPYAKSHVTAHAERLQIVDAETGERIFNVVEANAEEGWIVTLQTSLTGQYLRDARGRLLSNRRQLRKVRILEPIDDPTTVSTKLARAQAKRRRQAERQAKGMRT